MYRSSILSFLMLFLMAGSGTAAGFFDASQDVLRADVEYLVDLHVIRIPVTSWPIPIDDLHAAVVAADESALTPSALAALTRIKNKLDIFDTDENDTVTAAGSLHPTRFRLNEPLPRENADLTVAGGRDVGRLTAHLEVSGVTTPEDRQNLRLDGSYASLHVGNWMIGGGEIPHSWGPSQHDALSLSANARPIPAVSLDRVLSTAPRTRWLHWIGPWRLSTFLGTLDQARHDVRGPLFIGVRVAFEPIRGLEIGLQRNSQVCGKGRICNFTTAKDWLLGRTNFGLNGVTPATDPGNDEAGYDIRWTSPFKQVPFVVYGQMIGEDQEGGVPFKYLGEFGIETWKDLGNAGSVHVNLEYANTACSFTRSHPIYDCAYRHYIFNQEGWRYKGYVLGSSWDNDAEVTTLNLRWTQASGNEWQMHVSRGALNRSDILFIYNEEAPTRRELQRVQFEYRFSYKNWGDFRSGLGIESLRNTDTDHTSNTPQLFLIWTHRI